MLACTQQTRFSRSFSSRSACFWATLDIQVRREEIGQLFGVFDSETMTCACSGTSGVSSSSLRADSRRLRNWASNSFDVGAGSMRSRVRLPPEDRARLSDLANRKTPQPLRDYDDVAIRLAQNFNTMAAVPTGRDPRFPVRPWLSSRCVISPIILFLRQRFVEQLNRRRTLAHSGAKACAGKRRNRAPEGWRVCRGSSALHPSRRSAAKPLQSPDPIPGFLQALEGSVAHCLKGSSIQRNPLRCSARARSMSIGIGNSRRARTDRSQFQRRSFDGASPSTPVGSGAGAGAAHHDALQFECQLDLANDRRRPARHKCADRDRIGRH